MKQEIFFYGDSPYVTYDFLENRGVSKDIIYKNTSPKRMHDKKWHTSSLPSNRKNKIIAYESIPYSFIKEYKLPEISELRTISNYINQKLKLRSKVKILKVLVQVLDFEYNNWHDIKDIYENEFLLGEKLEMFCKTHVLLSKIIEFHKTGYTLKTLFDAYCRYSGLVFQSENYNSFCNKINRIKKEGSIEKVLIHGLTKLPSNNLKKEEDVIYEILRNYDDGKKPNAQTVLGKTNEYLIRTNRKTISISSIYNVISQDYVKNESALIRHGLKYVENNILPYSHFDAPSTEGMLWVMDGTRFQFAYMNEKSKYNFLTYFVVMEAFNRKIIGYSCAVSENSKMVFKALASACKETNILPREILSDKSSAFKTDDLIRIQALSKTWGCNWRKIYDPRDNSYVERFFGVFQEKVCKKYDGYL